MNGLSTIFASLTFAAIAALYIYWNQIKHLFTQLWGYGYEPYSAPSPTEERKESRCKCNLCGAHTISFSDNETCPYCGSDYVGAE